MSSRNTRGNASGRSARVRRSGSEDPSHASTVPSSPERLEATDQAEPFKLSGVATASNFSASAYATKDNLASALAGLEGKIAEMIASSSQFGRKCDRSHSPAPNLTALEQAWAGDSVLPLEDQEERQTDVSSSEDSESEEPVSSSQSQMLLVQALMEFVRSGYKMTPAKTAEASFSSLGLLKLPQNPHAFPVHPLLEQLMYAVWDNPDSHFLHPKRFSILYPMEEKCIKKSGVCQRLMQPSQLLIKVRPAQWTMFRCLRIQLTRNWTFYLKPPFPWLEQWHNLQ